MPKDETLEATLSRRNGQSVMLSLDQMNVRLAEYQDRLASLNTAVATLSNRLMVAEQFIALLRAERLGRGPTV